MKLLRKLALLCSAVALLAVAPAIHVAAQSDSASDSKAALIDINSATSDQLQVLDGVGPATADKIIAGRPFSNKSQLVSKGIMTQKVYDAIKDKIIAKQASDDSSSKSSKKSGKKSGKKKGGSSE